MNWSPQQEVAIESVKAWLADKNRNQIFRLFGYAGTGKTTLAKHLASDVKGLVCYASLTGKAAQVLRNKGCSGATTIHSLIYTPHVDRFTGVVTFSKNWDSPLIEAKLLIVDEVSMVDEELAKDLLEFGVPILVLGDPAQLPPVKGSGYFINAEPDVLLTEVHRQAAENPIIRLSMDIREGKNFYPGDWGHVNVYYRDDVKHDELVTMMTKCDQVLCGRNATRQAMNGFMRKRLGRTSNDPVIGDRLVCLRNDHKKGLFNGSLWEVVKVKHSPGAFELEIKSLDGDEQVFVDVRVLKEFFNGKESGLDWKKIRGTQQLTYGYALTVHKSQGSQWDDVLLFDESNCFGEDASKHLYTGVTRAATNLTVILR